MVWCFPLDTFHREISEYLVRHFLRDWFKSKINVDQLTLSILSGTGIIRDIQMDIEVFFYFE